MTIVRSDESCAAQEIKANTMPGDHVAVYLYSNAACYRNVDGHVVFEPALAGKDAEQMKRAEIFEDTIKRQGSTILLTIDAAEVSLRSFRRAREALLLYDRLDKVADGVRAGNAGSSSLINYESMNLPSSNHMVLLHLFSSCSVATAVLSVARHQELAWRQFHVRLWNPSGRVTLIIIIAGRRRHVEMLRGASRRRHGWKVVHLP